MMRLVVLLGFLVALLPSSFARAEFVPCVDPAQCQWTISVGGSQMMMGTYEIDADTGALALPDNDGDGTPDPVVFVGTGGVEASINSINGNVDPILGFGVGAATGGAGNTFSFTLSLPIALSGLLDADSSLSYSLSSLSAAGAQIAPLLGPKVLIAQEVDTTVLGLPPLNKGVDAGDTFAFLGGPQTQNSPVYTASNQFVGDLQYDLMSVTVAFSLSPNSSVGISGFVQQNVAAPEPAALVLLGMGLAALAVVRRRAAQ